MKKDEDIQKAAPTSNLEDIAHSSEEGAPSSEMQSPGHVLQAAREKQGLSIEEVSKQLKLKAEIIAQLETDSLDDNLHTPTFVRGYLCSYAKLLGIPVNQVSDLYDQTHDAKQSYNVRTQIFANQTEIKRSDSRIAIVTWGLVACLVVMSVAWWWQNREETVLTDMADLNVVDIIEQETDATKDITLTAVDDERGSVEEIQVVEEVKQPLAQVEEKVDPVTQTESAPVKAIEKPQEIKQETKTQASVVQGSSGRVVFNGDCWINIRGADGKSLINGVKKAGTEASFTGEAPFKVVLGAPSNVELFYAGKQVDLTEYSEKGKVARLTVGE